MAQNIFYTEDRARKLKLPDAEELKNHWSTQLGTKAEMQDTFTSWFKEAQVIHPDIYNLGDIEVIPVSVAIALYPEILFFGPQARNVIEALQFVLSLDDYIGCHPDNRKYLQSVFTEFGDNLIVAQATEGLTEVYEAQSKIKLVELISSSTYKCIDSIYFEALNSTPPIKLHTVTYIIALIFALSLRTETTFENTKAVETFDKAWKTLREKLGTISDKTKMPYFVR